MRRHLVPSVLLLAVAALCATPLTADLLHLEGGGVIDAHRWWVVDDTLMYENGSGTVGIPRRLVLRIEKTESTLAKAEPPLMPRTTGGSPPIRPALL